MRYTLLELTQRILESMDSDEVNTIAQTTESMAVANIIKECYFDIIGQLDLPEHQGIFNLTASGDNLKPCLMILPQTALDIKTLKYNNATVPAPVWYDVNYLPLNDFLQTINTIDTSLSTSGTMEILANGSTFTFKYMTNQHPHWYTSFDDRSIIFDSFDSDVDSTLQSVKTFCYGGITPTFTMSDTYVPDLDPRQFQLLLQSAKAQSFVELKQVENPKAEKKERRNTILAQRTKNAVDLRDGSQTYKRYGRK